MRSDSTYTEATEPRLDFGHVAARVFARLPKILLITAILCALAFAILLFVPKLYESSANILVEPRMNVYTSAATDQGTSQYLLDDAQISSQIELIKSRAIMVATIEAVGLRDVPEFAGSGGFLSLILGPPSAASLDERIIEKLRQRTTVTRERESRLLTVAVRSQDPELAATIANAIANAHVEARTRQQLSDTATATQWLDEEIDRLRESVNAAEAEVAEFRIANDLYVGANNTSISDQQLSTFSGQIAAAAERRGAARSRAEMIAEMIANGESVLGLPDVQSSPIIQSLSQELARLQGVRAERSATLLPSHPDIQAIDGQIAQLQAQINAEARRVAAAFQSQAEIEADLEQSLRTELAQATGVAGTATRQGVQLAELEREATAQRELLNAYLLRYTDAASRTQSGSALPDVRLVSEAAPSSNPAFPQTLLILLAIAIVSVVFQVAAIIFSELLSGRALRYDDQRMAAAPAPVVLTDHMPFNPVDGTPAATPMVPAEDSFAAGPGPADWGVTPASPIVLPVIAESLTPIVGEPSAQNRFMTPADAPADEASAPVDLAPASEEPTMLSLALSKVIAASDDVIAAMPAGYGVFSPEFLGHGYPVGASVEEPGAELMEPEAEADIVADAEMPIAGEEIAAAVALQDLDDDSGALEDAAASDVEPDLDLEPDPAATEETTLVDGAESVADVPPVLAGRTARERARTPFDHEIDRLAHAMLSGEPRTLIVAATTRWEDSCLVAEKLGERLLAGGLSVVEIDAASGVRGIELGLSDLAAGDADFGDVVHKSTESQFSFVPWGQGTGIERRSRKVATLVEALADVHECVIVVTGRLGMASLIGMFAGLEAECALVTGTGDVEGGVLEDLSELGFAGLHVVALDPARSDVA